MVVVSVPCPDDPCPDVVVVVAVVVAVGVSVPVVVLVLPAWSEPAEVVSIPQDVAADTAAPDTPMMRAAKRERPRADG